VQRKRTISRSSGSFTIGEVLVWMALLGVFLLIAGQMFLFSVKTMGDISIRENNLALTNSLYSQLGQDVWTAHDCLISDNRLVCDNGPDADLIQWVINSNGDVTRTVVSIIGNHLQIVPRPDLTTTWPRIGAEMRFAVSGLIVHVHDKVDGHDNVVELPETFKFYRSLEEASGK